MRRPRGLVDAVFVSLERQVGAAHALTGEAYALACEQSLGAGVDRRALHERLVLANRLLGELLSALCGMDRWDAETAALVAERAVYYRPCVDARQGDPHAYLVTLTRIAARYADQAHRALARFDRRPDSKIRTTISDASRHLFAATDVLNGEVVAG